MEDAILKQNVPGQWSRWDEDIKRTPEEGFNDYEDEGDEDNEDVGVENSTCPLDMDGIPNADKLRILAERDKEHQTGVKGVLADHKAAKEIDRLQKVAADKQRKVSYLQPLKLLQ